MVFESGGGPVVFAAPASEFRDNWQGMCTTPQKIVFMCTGPDESIVRRLVEHVRQVKTDLGGRQHPAAAPGQFGAGATYVYVYRDPDVPPGSAGNWSDLFYIGVGSESRNDGLYGGRWTQHVIDALYRNGNAPRHERIRAWFRNNPCPKGKEREHAVKRGLVRKLYAFSGNGAPELKFFTEQFLIAQAFGAHNLENETSGNWRTGAFAGISRPFVFDASRLQHVWSWSQLLDAFVDDPNAAEIKNSLEPALLTLVAANVVPGLDTALAPLGLVPLQKVPEGRLAVQASFCSHLNVSGAGDCMISYQHPDRSYRFDLRFSKTQPALRINMRPLNRAGYRPFVQAINGTHFLAPSQLYGFSVRDGSLLQHYGGVSPVRNVDEWPYYKPMGDGNGRKDQDWFGVSWPPGQVLQFRQNYQVRPPWLHPAGPNASLDLVGALELILGAFP
jgi:hypothetical protein